MINSTFSLAQRFKVWIPPIAAQMYWRLFPLFRHVRSDSKELTMQSNESGWNDPKFTELESKKWNQYTELVNGTGPVGFSHEQEQITSVRNLYHHNVHMAFCYAMALATGRNHRPVVLDYGGGLGHYYKLACAMVPQLACDYHIMELPGVVDSGRKLNPEITWHTDDLCFEPQYDFVFVNGSLQYIDKWQELLRKLANCTRHYFLLTRVPVVQRADRYAAIQTAYGTSMIQWQYNEGELLAHMASCGLKLMREILVGGVPYIRGAPEQPEMRGWLFVRGQDASLPK